MGILGRKEILESADDDLPAMELVPLPNGDQVRIRVMSTAQLDAYEKSMVKIGKTTQEPAIDNKRAKLLVQCICDEKGRLLLGAGDIEALGRKSSDWIGPIYDRAVEMNHLNKSVDDLAKNSGSPQPSDSVSD